MLNDKSLDLILEFEVGGGENYYNKFLKNPTYRSYVNYITVCGSEVPTLLGDDSPYTIFNIDFNSNATSQWLGPNTTKVKVKKLSQIVQDDTYDSWRTINGSATIPTFSTADNDAIDGRAEYVSLHMYLAEVLFI